MLQQRQHHYMLSQALFLCRLWERLACRHATFFAFLLYSLFNIIVVVVVLPVNEAYTVVGWLYCCFYNAYLLCSMLLLLMLPLSFCLVRYIHTYMHTYTHGTIHTLQHTPTNSTRTTATCHAINEWCVFTKVDTFDLTLCMLDTKHSIYAAAMLDSWLLLNNYLF